MWLNVLGWSLHFALGTTAMAKNQASAVAATARILIVDDHPVVREGLATRISACPDLEICGEAADTPEAVKLAFSLRPDLAIVDISLKTGNGIDLIKRLLKRTPALRILVWSMHSDYIYAERALRAGAQGYLCKEQATDKLVEAIRRVLDGKVYLSDEMAETLLHRNVGASNLQAGRPPIESLSNRELEVFQSIGRGQDTLEIAKKMRLSPKTVETYRARIKTKLMLRNGHDLIRRAVQWVEHGNL